MIPGEFQVDEYAEGRIWVDGFFVPTEFAGRVCGFAVRSEDFAVAGISVVVELEPDTEPWELEHLYEDAQADASFEQMRDDQWVCCTDR